LWNRFSKLSNVFYKEREVFKETKDVRNWLDTMFVLVSGKIKRGELGEYFEVCFIIDSF